VMSEKIEVRHKGLALKISTVECVKSGVPGEFPVTQRERHLPQDTRLARCWRMRATLILLVRLLCRVASLLGTGGARALLAENLILKHQLLVLRRNRPRARVCGPPTVYFSTCALGSSNLADSCGRPSFCAPPLCSASIMR